MAAVCAALRTHAPLTTTKPNIGICIKMVEEEVSISMHMRSVCAQPQFEYNNRIKKKKQQ